jgi:hypothetical protein
MAKPNYAFQKRQRELAKKQKKEEKQKRKAAEEHRSSRHPSETKPETPEPMSGSRVTTTRAGRPASIGPGASSRLSATRSTARRHLADRGAFRRKC